MTTPYEHTHVEHLVKTKRRRSHSLTLPNVRDKDDQVQHVQQRQFLAQLRKEHHSRDGDDFTPTVTRVTRIAASRSIKKYTSSTTRKTVGSSDEDDFEPVVTRVLRTATTPATQKHASLSPATIRAEVPSAESRTTQMQDDKQNADDRSQVIQLAKSESVRSARKPLSIIAGPSSIISKSKTKLDSPSPYIDLDLNSSHASSNPYATSSTNILSRSQVFDQEFHLDDSEAHARRNDVKSHGRIQIGEREKHYTIRGKKLTTKSNAGFMAAVIAIIIGVIAFALALTAFILVLLLRSTVEASLVSNSTTTKNIGSLPSACSTYTTIDDPTRNVNAAGYALGCDNTAPFINYTNPVWIRFVGAGGTTLPLTTPGLNLCGSTGTGWYKGIMPSTTGEIVNGTACFTWITGVCRMSSSISVANCGSFYIYLLPPPPACMMRYCTI